MSANVENLKVELDRLRKEIAETRRAETKIENLPKPAADQLRPLVTLLESANGNVPARILDNVRHFSRLFGPPGAPDLILLEDAFVYLHRDQLKKQVTDDVKAQLRGKETLTDSEKLAEVEKLRAERLRLERAEEKLVRELESIGLDVPRRPDLAPQVFLGIGE